MPSMNFWWAIGIGLVFIAVLTALTVLFPVS